MPIYEFMCQDCGQSFESLVSIGKESSVLCISCGSKNIRKLVSRFGIGGGISQNQGSGGSCSSCSSSSCDTCR